MMTTKNKTKEKHLCERERRKEISSETQTLWHQKANTLSLSLHRPSLPLYFDFWLYGRWQMTGSCAEPSSPSSYTLSTSFFVNFKNSFRSHCRDEGMRREEETQID
mmetsp:Transcript_21386/g.41931  ORF Transcript_21386/g.41931 Transcript_21386/m.41931 type:complete len:106 (+) Transcript_21386:115-432(+)